MHEPIPDTSGIEGTRRYSNRQEHRSSPNGLVDRRSGKRRLGGWIGGAVIVAKSRHRPLAEVPGPVPGGQNASGLGINRAQRL